MKSFAMWAAAPLAVVLSASTAAAQQCAPASSGQGPYGAPACGPACGGTVHGGYTPMQMHTFQESYRDNAIWPRQYIAPSRRGICQAYETMINNGWRKHNLLGKYHFTPDSDELSEAGRLKVQWILTQAPQHRRSIFVERAAEVDRTAQRVAAVQQLSESMAAGPGAADIQETHLHDEGRPAAAVDAMFTGFRTSSPPPVLPQSSSSDSGE